MFKLVNEYTFNWPVKVSLPMDGGEYQQHTFNVRFLYLEEPELKEHTSDDRAFLRRVVRDVSGIGDEDGRELPFTPEMLEQLMNHAPVRVQMVRAYWEAMRGAALGKN